MSPAMAQNVFPVSLPSGVRGASRSTCGCNSSQNRPLQLLNCNSDHDGVFIVHYIRLIWDSCCMGKHMNVSEWTFGTINRWPCWFCGFQTVPSVNRCTVSSLTPPGSSHVWQKDTSRCRGRLPELSFIHDCGPHFIFPLIYNIYNLCRSSLQVFTQCLDPWGAGLSWNKIK